MHLETGVISNSRQVGEILKISRRRLLEMTSFFYMTSKKVADFDICHLLSFFG